MADEVRSARMSVETSTQLFLHVQQHAAGKGDLYERSCTDLVGRYSDRLFVYLSRWVKPQDAEDLLQILFVKVFQNIDRFDRSRARPFTWMCAIARNVFIDSLRRRQNTPELTRFDLEPLDTPDARSEFDALVEWDLWETAERTIRNDVEETTWQAYLRLTHDHQSPAFVASALNSNEATIQRYKNRVLQKVKTEYDRLKREVEGE